MDDEFPESALAKQMFPEWFSQQKLIDAMTILREDRFDYNNARHLPPNHPGKINIMKRSTNLLERIQVFFAEQAARVSNIETMIDTVESHLVYAAILARKHNLTLPVDSDLLTWDMYDKDDYDVNWETFDRAAWDETLYNLRDYRSYEAVIVSRLKKAMRDFAKRGSLRGNEFEEWNKRTKLEESLTSKRLSLFTTIHQVFKAMERRMEDEINKMQKERLPTTNEQRDPNIAHEKTKATLNAKSQPMPLIYNPEHPLVAMRVKYYNKGEYCEYCMKSGHLTVNCQTMFMDNENINFCTVCRERGHHRRNCWVVNPALKEAHDRKVELERKKDTCDVCGAVGFARTNCYRIHAPKKSVHANVGPAWVRNAPGLSYGEIPFRGQQSDALNVSWDFPTPSFVKFTHELIDAGRKVIKKEPAVRGFDEKYCAYCNVYGHSDMDCTVPDSREVQEYRAPPIIKRLSKFAKAAK